MKATRSIWILGIGLCSLVIGTLSADAIDPSEIAGTWRVVNFSTPNRLTLQTDPQGVVVGISEASNFERSTGSLIVLSNGTFSGNLPDPISGTIASGGQGEIILHFDGTNEPASLTFHLNRTSDFMTTCGSFGEGSQDLILALRAPEALNTNDLAGLWNATGFKTPYQLDLERNASNQVINIQGLDAFGAFGGTLSVSNDGTLGGQIQDSFTGTVGSVGSGLVNLVINSADGAMPITLFVNASKDVMVLLEAAYDTNDNFQDVIVFQKAPVTNAVADQAGHWRVISYDVPHLTQQKNAQGQVIGLVGANEFQTARQHLVVGYDGFFTAQVGGTATGTLTPGTNGLVTINVQSADGAETFDFHLNASKTLLASARSLGDGHEFLLVTQSAPVPGPALDFGLVMFADTNGLTFDWAATTNGGLQVSGDLTNWVTVTNSIGQHTYSAPTTNAGANLYRVFQPLP